jgi:16S rRNA (cytosine967-C5)-methyltransferase
VFPEENQRQVDIFLKAHPDAEQLMLTAPLAGLSLENGQLQPSAQHDGLFYALLQKH